MVVGDTASDGEHASRPATAPHEVPGRRVWHDPADLPGPDHPDAPRTAYALVRGGEVAAGLRLARALLKVDLDTVGASHRADLVVCRLWAARVERRTDPAAFAAATRLVDSASIDPPRRALLHFTIAAALLDAVPGPFDPELQQAGDHLDRSLELALNLGLDELAASCLSRLAVVELPAAHLAVITAHSTRALETFATPAGRLTRWQVRAILVQQWSRYYQGLPLDLAALQLCLDLPTCRIDAMLLPYRGALAAVVASEAGDVQRARLILDETNADRRVRTLGLWRAPLMMMDGYLGVHSDDAARVRALVGDLTSLPLPGEALLLRAAFLSHIGETGAALATIRPVTAATFRSVGLTLPVANALEAVLHAAAGDRSAALASMRQALGAAEPMDAMRVFAIHDRPTTLDLLDEVISAGSGAWARRVRAYVAEREPPTGGTPRTTPLPIEVRDAVALPLPEKPALPAALPESPLTVRELDVLVLADRGLDQKAIARRLYVSPNTVKTHLHSIRQKLGVRRTTEATALARSAGWLDRELP